MATHRKLFAETIPMAMSSPCGGNIEDKKPRRGARTIRASPSNASAPHAPVIDSQYPIRAVRAHRPFLTFGADGLGEQSAVSISIESGRDVSILVVAEIAKIRTLVRRIDCPLNRDRHLAQRKMRAGALLEAPV